MKTTRRILSRAALFLAGLAVAGCSAVSLGGSYGSNSGLSGVRVGVSSGYYRYDPGYTYYRGYGSYPGYAYYRGYGYNPGYAYYPGALYFGRPGYHHRYADRRHRHDHDRDHRYAGGPSYPGVGTSPGGVRVGGRDFRQGDSQWRRDMSRRDGSTSLGERTRRERSEIIREQRQDRTDAARWSRSKGVAIEGAPQPDFDTAAERRQDRATQAEREAQRKALKVRQEMLAKRRAEKQAVPEK